MVRNMNIILSIIAIAIIGFSVVLLVHDLLYGTKLGCRCGIHQWFGHTSRNTARGYEFTYYCLMCDAKKVERIEHDG